MKHEFSDYNMDLLKYKAKLRIRDSRLGKTVFDPIRKKEIRLNKEELVRQLLLIYLMEEQDVQPGRIAVERGFKVEKLNKRFDILIFDKNARPLMIIECKNSDHPINQKVIDQAGIYNSKMKTPFLMLSNGIESLIFKIDFESGNFEKLDVFPDLN